MLSIEHAQIVKISKPKIRKTMRLFLLKEDTILKLFKRIYHSQELEKSDPHSIKLSSKQVV